MRWIASKLRTMAVVNKNWVATVTHLSSIAESSSSVEVCTAKGLVLLLSS